MQGARLNTHRARDTEIRPMIISASRRTDIPAFYTPWFMNRLREGWCLVPNPFRAMQVSEVSLKAEDVDVLVFWTRNALPLLPHLQELEERGYRSYFLYTLMHNPAEVDSGCPPLEGALRTFKALADRVGPQKAIWRYDPIVITSLTDPDFHKEAFRRIATALRGYTERCVISIMHPYRKAERRFTEEGIELKTCEESAMGELLRFMAGEAQDRGMEIQSCAQGIELEAHGVRQGKCVDDGYLAGVFGIDAGHTKDRSQRRACGCIKSKDIGMYDTCLYGCLYCYATGSFKKAAENYRRHDPNGPSLIPVPREREFQKK